MQSKIEVLEVSVNTHIGDNGIVVDTIMYEVGNIDGLLGLRKEDFDITIGNKKYSATGLSYVGNTLELTPEPFNFEGAAEYKDGKFIHHDFTVKCVIDELSFTKDNCKLHIKTVDNFTSGTYKASNGYELPYWLYIPEEQDALPLMVWLHGGGEVLETSYEGANLTKNRGATCWIESGMTTAVLSVQFPKNYPFGISNKPDELKIMEAYNVVQYELIQELISKGKIDPKRVYVSGASSGGGGVLRFIMQYPDLFAAALPICAKDTLIPISEPYQLAFKMQGSLEIADEEYEKCYNDIAQLMQQYGVTNVPIWFIHAENDPVCTSYTSSMMYDVLKEMGAEHNKITLYTDQEMLDAGVSFYHGSWIPAFNDTDVTDWIYSKCK